MQPPNSDVIKTLPDRGTPTLSGELPVLDGDVSERNDSYLETMSGLMGDRWILITAAPVTIIALLGSIAFGIYCFAQPDSPIDVKMVIPLLVGMFCWAAVYNISMVFFCYEDEPIRFNRRDKKVYWFRAPRRHWPGFGLIPTFGKPEVKVYDWANLRGEIVRKMIFTGKTARRDSYLELAHIDPSTGLVTERFRVGQAEAFGDFSSRVALWETLRRYMEIGPSAVPDAALNVHRGTLVDCIDEFNPLTLARRFAPGAARIIGYFMMLVMLPVAPMFLLMGLSKWIANLTAKKVDWGDLENTVFKLSPDDPSLKRSLDPAVARPGEWQAELRHRRIMASVWIIFVAAEIAAFLWWVTRH